MANNLNPQKLIVIGNGPTLLEKENGQLIDSFDKVVRFNGYTIDKFEKNVGTRVDIWFNVINFSKKDTEWRLKKPYDKIVLHSWQWDPEKDALYTSFVEHYKNTNMFIEKTKRSTCVELCEYISITEKEYFSYSTGVIAIWMLLKEYSDITITGFDWWAATKHHYNDNAPRGTLHKPDIEKRVIDKLIEQNKIKFLG